MFMICSIMPGSKPSDTCLICDRFVTDFRPICVASLSDFCVTCRIVTGSADGAGATRHRHGTATGPNVVYWTALTAS